MSELARRVLTAAVLIPAVVALVEWGPTVWIAIAFGLIVLAGAWEWARFAGWNAPATRAAYVALTAAALVGFGWQGLQLGSGTLAPAPYLVEFVLVWGIGWWGLALALVLARQRAGVVPEPPEPVTQQTTSVRTSIEPARAAIALAGWSVLIPAWVCLVLLHARVPLGPHLVLVLLLVIWAADIGAYFGGRRFGRRRLASAVSPGKSWEGAWSGLAIALAVGIGVGAGLGLTLPGFVVVLVATVVVSVLGDLTESLFKRRAGVKDSGGLLPGHGGVLDRIDSLTAGAPVFLLGCMVIGA